MTNRMIEAGARSLCRVGLDDRMVDDVDAYVESDWPAYVPDFKAALTAALEAALEDEGVKQQLREVGTAALSGTGQPDPDYYEDFDLMFSAAFRALIQQVAS